MGNTFDTLENNDNQLFLGDCLEIMRGFPSECIDTIVTSPPYNKTGFRGGEIGHSNKFRADMEYGAYDDNMPERYYWAWQNILFDEFYRILKPTGSLFYNHIVRRYEGKAHHPMTELRDVRLNFYQQIIWDRLGSFNNNLTYLDLGTELIFWFVKGKPVVHKDVKYRGEIWRIKPTGDPQHPAPFPVALPKNCILLTTNLGDTILDPFMGIGSTGIASIQTGRKFIGIDIDPRYVDIARGRMRDTLRQPSLFETLVPPGEKAKIQPKML
jgi:site-specific DNA-methyltransferase (adenine-specific)